MKPGMTVLARPSGNLINRPEFAAENREIWSNEFQASEDMRR
jgi:hypothetical protein